MPAAYAKGPPGWECPGQFHPKGREKCVKSEQERKVNRKVEIKRGKEPGGERKGRKDFGEEAKGGGECF